MLDVWKKMNEDSEVPEEETELLDSPAVAGGSEEERSEADAPGQEPFGDVYPKDPKEQMEEAGSQEDKGINSDSDELIEETGSQEVKGVNADSDELAESNIIQETQDLNNRLIQEEPDEVLPPRHSSTEEEEPAKVVIRHLHSETSEKKEKTTKDKGLLYSFLDTLRFVCLGLVIGIVLVIFVIQRNDVYGESMAPVLHDGDAVFVEMISTYMKSYDKGDIVTIFATGMEGYDKQEKLIKRIIAGPNDTVTIRDGAVFVNDVLIDEPYLADGVPTYCNEASIAKGYDNITLKEGEYYVMGDNRGASLDSRIIGPIPVDRIKAHVIIKIFPFNDLKVFQ
jgi:signal peptidase I